MKKFLLGFIVIGLFTFLVGCELQKGCTEPNTINFDSAAKENDGSCTYIKLATLTRTSVSNITSSIAFSGGSISNDGGAMIIARGIY